MLSIISGVRLPWIWGQSEHDVSNGLLVIVFPILDFLLVGHDVLIRWCLFSGERNTPTVEGDVCWTFPGEYTPLALRHEEAFHGNGPDLVVGAGEDGHKGGEAGRHVLVRLVRG